VIVDAVLDQMLLDGCTAVQIVNALKADRAEARARREAARARRAGAAVVQLGQVESGLRIPVGLDLAGSGSASRDAPSPVAPASADGLAHPRVKLAVARKAIPLCRLTPNAQAVFAALLDFCNVETLRCYPGIGHIARKLGRHEQKDPSRHIRRGIAELVKAGLLKVAAHAGLRHSNAYFPQWDRLAAIVAAFEAGEGVKPSDVRVQSDSPDRIVLQNQKKNLPSVGRRVQRAKQPDRAQRELMLPVVLQGGRATDAPSVPAGMPREQAGLRVMQAISRHVAGKGQGFAQQVREAIGPQLLEQAIAAEARARGSGFPIVLEALGPGPPKAWNGEVSDSLRAVLKRG